MQRKKGRQYKWWENKMVKIVSFRRVYISHTGQGFALVWYWPIVRQSRCRIKLLKIKLRTNVENWMPNPEPQLGFAKCWCLLVKPHLHKTQCCLLYFSLRLWMFFQYLNIIFKSCNKLIVSYKIDVLICLCQQSEIIFLFLRSKYFVFTCQYCASWSNYF